MMQGKPSMISTTSGNQSYRDMSRSPTDQQMNIKRDNSQTKQVQGKQPGQPQQQPPMMMNVQTNFLMTTDDFGNFTGQSPSAYYNGLQ